VTTNDQPTNDQRRHDTAYLNKRLFYWRKVRRLIIIIIILKLSRQDNVWLCET